MNRKQTNTTVQPTTAATQVPAIYELDLAGRDYRAEEMTAMKARVLNADRDRNSYPGRWTQTNDATAAEVAVRREPMTAQARKDRFRAGLQADDTWFNTLTARKGKESDVSETTTEKTATTKKAKAPKAEKVEKGYNGHNQCSLLRYCGAKGFSKPKSRAVLEALGLSPADATVHIQVAKGAKGEQVPELDKETRVKIKEVAAGITDEKPVKKAKADGAAKGEKAKAPKAKKAKAPAAEADAADEAGDDDAAEDTGSDD
jgi:hypothetical protein